jgi:hypothetical protein
MRLFLAILTLLAMNSANAQFIKAKGTGRALTKNLAIDELVDSAGIIFKGRLETVQYTQQEGLDVRELRFKVLDAIQGVDGEELVLHEWAGVGSPMTTEVVKGMPYVFFYHEPSERGLTSLIGMDQGVVSVDRNNRVKFAPRLSLKPKKRTLIQMISGQPQIDNYQSLKDYCSR